MAYQALYRSYRPMSFKDVVGQEHVIHTLQNAIKENKTSHAYVFSGLRGVGKTTIARILAKAVNCESPVDGEPCNCCACCKAINEGTTTDIIELDAASNNGVDEIREILEKVNYQPSFLKKKVYIIDEVHMLTTSAFNALLKTLEEPPKFVMFILATTEPHKIPATILSRCQRFDFKQLTLPELSNHLLQIANEENIKITEEAVMAISEAADGGMRDAISILDQTSTYSSSEITIDDVNNITGNVTNECLINVINDLNESASSDAIKHINEIINNGKETARVINGLIEFCRDLLLWIELDEKPTNKSIYQNTDFILLASHSDVNRLFYYIDVLNDTLNKIKYSTTPKIYLEVAIMKIVNNATAQTEVMSKIQELEEKIKTVGMINNNSSYQGGYSAGYDSLIKNLQSDVQSIKVSLENDPMKKEIRLIEAKLNSQYYELVEKIESSKLEKEKEQPIEQQNSLFSNSFDDGTINEINRKIDDLKDSILSINSEIRLLKEKNSSNSHIEELQDPLFTNYDEIEQNNPDIALLKQTIKQMEEKINNLSKNSIDLSPIYDELENIKVDLSTLFERFHELNNNQKPVVEEIQQEENNQETIENQEPLEDAHLEENNPNENEEPVSLENQPEENILEDIEETVEDSNQETTEEIVLPENQMKDAVQEDIELSNSDEIIEEVNQETTEEIVSPENQPEETIDETNQEMVEEIISPENIQENPEVTNMDSEPIESNETETDIDITEEVYNIHILEEILNDAWNKECRLEKPEILERWKTMVDIAGGKLKEVAKMLSYGKMQANGFNKLLIVFDSVIWCNVLMTPDKHEQAKELLKYTLNKDYDFLALPINTWEEKLLEYRNLYSMGDFTPSLKPFNNPELKVVIRDSESNLNKNEKLNKDIDDFFGEN